jgi:formiminoglutamate deiminase
MHYIHAGMALLPTGWASQVRIGLSDGRIASLEIDSPPERDDSSCHVVLPGMPNLHSHAFQRALSGLTEVPGESADSFWSWRDIMYRYALSMTPDQLDVVASQVYVEMLEAGFTRVGEFHYLHHDRDGQPYRDIAEMASRIASAAFHTGIGLTLLPVFYAHSNFCGLDPGDEQRRFVTDLDRYARLLAASREVVQDLPTGTVGVAPHSLRAVTPDELTALSEMQFDGPMHIHVAEQTREVDDCVAWSGMRPVEWLLNHADIDERWCLVHATQMTDAETRQLARTGAVAGLCPLTEANLGDGTFAGAPFVEHGGRYGVGSDSNSRISVADELRQLEYSQRLTYRQRNVMAADGTSTGRALFESAVRGGSQALAGSGAGIEQGAPADLVALDSEVVSLTDGDRALDSWLFGQGVRVDAVWVAGQQVVTDGRHHRREDVSGRFRRVMLELTNTA